jgi:membrane-associated phospholipid phosphatase
MDKAYATPVLAASGFGAEAFWHPTVGIDRQWSRGILVQPMNLNAYLVHRASNAEREDSWSRIRLTRVLATLESHERIGLVYFAWTSCLSFVNAHGRTLALHLCLLIGFAATIALRQRTVTMAKSKGASAGAWWRLGALVARIAPGLALPAAYVVMGELLQHARPLWVADDTLLRIDQAIFGKTPAEHLESWASLGAVEYFAAYYDGYFLLITAMFVRFIALERNDDVRLRFLRGTFYALLVGQVLYVFVPAYGPIWMQSQRFVASLPTGPFRGWILGTIGEFGRLTDCFPSLHTGLPTWFSMFLWSEARRIRSKRSIVVATVVSFIAVQIMFSTMFLRFHYGIDVIAGIMHACCAFLYASRRPSAKPMTHLH